MTDKFEISFIAVVIAILSFFVYALLQGTTIGYQPPSACSVYPAVNTFKSGVVEIQPGVYEVRIVAARYYFDPSTIILKNPKKVIFEILSKDVLHGFEIVGTNVNVMVLPYYQATFTWDVPSELKGNFMIICNEYCGNGHPNMYAELIIER
ncbi:MAG TPA: hypothetical protein VKU94_04970 [Geobacterales bacterium]|nr:hypothetical protein [Geobacterales bacterium]